MYDEWLFFQSTVDLIKMVVAKTGRSASGPFALRGETFLRASHGHLPSGIPSAATAASPRAAAGHGVVLGLAEQFCKFVLCN